MCLVISAQVGGYRAFPGPAIAQAGLGGAAVPT
jgi:hypothetical protein